MTALRTFVRDHFPALVLLTVAAGFAVTLAELLLMEHTDGKQLVAVVAGVAGIVLPLVGLVARGGLAMVVVGLLGVVGLTGVVGVYFHLGGGEAEASRPIMTAVQQVLRGPVAHADEDDDDDEAIELASGSVVPASVEEDVAAGPRDEGHEEEEEGEGPPLAPLGVTGLAMLGMLGVLARRE